MHSNDTQQEHSYKFIQNLSSLLDKIKKEGDLIYDARIVFYTAKFLIEHADLDLDEDENKNKACKVILQEYNEIKEDRQELASEVKKRLKDYIDDGVEKVSINGNHASITLEDNKKEFKISEFLNSDFCEKNGISGFSTLHSDGKSGMHGFVAEEGEGKEKRKVRHYVVTDGSYEMTLNWYDAKGEKCTIKINIDKEGVELIEGNGVTEDQLKANQDVKIGGLFLHQIQFREKGQGKANEVEQNASEIIIENSGRGVGVQTTQNRGVGSQTPPQVPTRTSSLPPKENVVNEQGRSKLGSQKPDGNEQTLDNQQQPETPQQGKDLWQDIRGFNKSNLRHTGVDGREASIKRSGKNDSSTDVKTVADPTVNKQPFSFATPKSTSDSGYSFPTINHSQSEREQAQQVAEENISKDRFTEKVLEKIEKGNQYDPIRKWLEKKVAEQENAATNPNKLLEKDAAQLSPISTDENKESLIDVEQKDDTLLTEFTSKLDKETQKFPLRPVNQKEMSKRTRELLLEDGLLEGSSTGVETVEGPTVSVSASTPNSISDSGYISPTDTDHDESQVNSKQIERELEGHIRQSNPTLFEELKNTLGQKNLGLKPVNQEEMSERTRERLLKDGLLKDSSTDVETATERENDADNTTIDENSELYKLLKKDAAQLKAGVIEEEIEGTLTEHTGRVTLANSKKRPLDWAKRIAESQQEKDTNKGIST
ncbi:hypothetical protein [Wolbachia endosymbiont of Cantharis cryptica]|uniref:hypothetical protein n=1 Tax=Wolbachia endosymbiont of Cantharis cryptica TaxID=3066132 RepID=UPI00376EFB93